MRRDDIELPPAPANDRPSARYLCGKPCNSDHRVVQDCPLGPTAAGICRHDKGPCTPVATAALRSRRWRVGLLLFGVLVISVASSTWRNEFYKPGPLSTPHAQILAGQVTKASCAACHPEASASPLQWFLSGHSESSSLQSDRCMDCHHTRLPRDFARTAHNLSAEQLRQLGEAAVQTSFVGFSQWLPRPAFANTDVACSACHREHAGADASLTSLSDAQCQTCHSNRFNRFATDHPSWDQWPYTANEPIAFDHRSHAQRHFPSARDQAGLEVSFDCIRCHAKNESGEFSRMTNYATGCGDCHDQSLNQQVGERLDLLVVPSLIDPDLQVVGPWPTAATGFYDGHLGPLARFLLSTKSEYRDAISSLPLEGDFTRIRSDSREQRRAAEVIAVAVRDLIQRMAVQGPIPATSESLPEQLALRRMLQGLSPQLISAASHRWFGRQRMHTKRDTVDQPAAAKLRLATVREAVDSDALLSDDDLDVSPSDPLANIDPLLSESGDDALRADATTADPLGLGDPYPETKQPDGGWYVDESRMAVSYRGHGHADPVIRAAIELAAGLSAGDTIRQDLLRTGPASACIRCHPGVADSASVGVAWKPAATNRDIRSQFTKFSHKPHMNLPILADCKHCHAISDDVNRALSPLEVTTVFASENITDRPPHDFSPLSRQACASCHTANAAGDACIKCHRYHTQPPGIP